MRTQQRTGGYKEAPDFLEMFAKPRKISVDEVRYYGEQKMWLVCKGKISKFNYICPGCSALYCVKCTEALSNLENACWVCELPFDKSKPVQLIEKLEEEHSIEGGIEKASKNGAK